MITTSPALNTAFIETIADEYVVPDGMPLAVFNNKYSRVKSVEPNPAFDPSKEESPVNQKNKTGLSNLGRTNQRRCVG